MELEPIAKAGSAQSIPEVSSAPKKVEMPHTEVVAGTAPVKESTETQARKGETGEGRNGEQKDRAVSETSIDDAVRSANHKMTKTRCEYAYHKETNRVSIRVFDADTDEVIREIPPEKSLDMLEKLWEMAGILVDEKK